MKNGCSIYIYDISSLRVNRQKVLRSANIYLLYAANEVLLHRVIAPVVCHTYWNICILLCKSETRELRTIYVIVDLHYK